MKNPKHKNHEAAASLGGSSQSQKKHYCPLCQIEGQGNRFKGHHLDNRLCEGKGLKNYYSKQKRK